PELLLVVGNAVALDQLDEVRRRVARQRRLAEVRVRGDVVAGAGAGVGEVAASAAGHEDLLADAVGVLEHARAQPAATGGDRAHEAGGAAADDQDVAVVAHGRRLSRRGAGVACAAGRVGVAAYPAAA